MFFRAPSQPRRMGVVASAIHVRSWVTRVVATRDHGDAINRAWCNAELTTRAQRSYDRMRLLPGADDCINRAGWEAFDAADAASFVDDRNQRCSLNTVVGVQGQPRAMEQTRKRGDRGTATGRALVDRRGVAGNRLRIRPTPVVTAACALRLR